MSTSGELRYHSKSEYAYAAVRELIVAGTIEPGTTIAQARVAADLGVSTTPLREALKRLAQDGLVELGSYREARVVPLSSTEAQHLLELRIAVDPTTTGLAARRRTADDIAEIERALTELEPLTSGASPHALAAHRQFHRAIYLASANPLLVGVLDSLWDRTDLYRRRALASWVPNATERKRVHGQHVALRDAVAEGDADAARELAEAHITHSLGRRAVGLLLDPDDDGGAVLGAAAS